MNCALVQCTAIIIFLALKTLMYAVFKLLLAALEVELLVGWCVGWSVDLLKILPLHPYLPTNCDETQIVTKHRLW